MAGKVCIPFGLNNRNLLISHLANSTTPNRFMYGSSSNHLSLYTYFLFTDGRLCCFWLLTSPLFILHGCNICPTYLLRLSNIAQGIFEPGIAALWTFADLWLLLGCNQASHARSNVIFWDYCAYALSFFSFKWIPHAWIILASWSYYEPFFERHVCFVSVTTALWVELTNFCIQISTLWTTY